MLNHPTYCVSNQERATMMSFSENVLMHVQCLGRNVLQYYNFACKATPDILEQVQMQSQLLLLCSLSSDCHCHQLNWMKVLNVAETDICWAHSKYLYVQMIFYLHLNQDCVMKKKRWIHRRCMEESVLILNDPRKDLKTDYDHFVRGGVQVHGRPLFLRER